MDNTRQFTTDKDTYVFDVMAGNYQNGSFARQKIWLDQGTYAPRKVEVSDTNATVMVEVNFDSFEFGKKFDKSAFDMDKNMGTVPNSKPSEGSESPDGSKAPDASASPDATASPDNETTAQPEKGAEPDLSNPAEEPEVALTIAMPDPDALPVGVELKDQSDVQIGEHMGVMLRYTGTYDFTIVEMLAKDRAVTLSEGITLDLGFTLGHLTEGASSTLTWSNDGVEYRLSTADLPNDDMVKIAQSMQESSGK